MYMYIVYVHDIHVHVSVQWYMYMYGVLTCWLKHTYCSQTKSSMKAAASQVPADVYVMAAHSWREKGKGEEEEEKKKSSYQLVQDCKKDIPSKFIIKFCSCVCLMLIHVHVHVQQGLFKDIAGGGGQAHRTATD